MGRYRPRSIPEYLSILWRRKLLIFLIAAAMLISTFLVISRIPDVYESRALVVVSSQQYDKAENNSQIAAIKEVNGAQIAEVANQLTSRSNLEALIRRHNLYGSAASIDHAVDQMSKDLRFETKLRADVYPRSPESFTIAYRYSDPVVAQQVATDLVALFEKANETATAQAGNQAEAVGVQLAELQTRLEELDQQRQSARNGAVVASRAAVRAYADTRTVRAQRAAASASVEALNDRVYVLEQQIAEQKKQIAEQEKIAKAAQPAGGARGSSSYGVLLVRKAELEAQLKGYAAQYTDKNPKVVEAKTQLAEINRQIAQLESASSDSGPANTPEARELRAMQRELVRLETELEVTKRQINRKQEAAGGDSTIVAAAPAPRPVFASTAPSTNVQADVEYERLRSQYRALLDKQEWLQKMQASPAGLIPALFEVVDLPNLPQSPAGPNRGLLQLIALGLALVVAFVVVIALEAPRLFVIHNDRDVEYFLGAPVVALIPETLTPAEHGRTRMLKLARGLGVALLVAMMIPLFFLLLNGLQIFQILARR